MHMETLGLLRRCYCGGKITNKPVYSNISLLNIAVDNLITRMLRIRPGSGGSRFASVKLQRSFSEYLVPVHTALTSLHQFTGLSWPVLIPLTTIGLRLALTTPLAVLNRKRAQKQAKLAPLLQAMVPVFKAQLAAGAAAKRHELTAEQIGVLATKERRKQRISLYKEAKCQNWRMLLLPAIQIPLFVAMSLTLRSMCGWSVLDSIPLEQGFTEQGFGWIQSLDRPDNYGILPLAVGAFSLGNVELHSRALPTNSQGPSVAAALINFSRFGCVLFMAMAFQAPSAIGLYWLSSNAFSFVQTALMDKYLPIRVQPDYPTADPTVSSK